MLCRRMAAELPKHAADWLGGWRRLATVADCHCAGLTVWCGRNDRLAQQQSVGTCHSTWVACCGLAVDTRGRVVQQLWSAVQLHAHAQRVLMPAACRSLHWQLRVAHSCGCSWLLCVVTCWICCLIWLASCRLVLHACPDHHALYCSACIVHACSCPQWFEFSTHDA